MCEKSPRLPLHNANFGIFIACMAPDIFSVLGTDTARPDFEITTFIFENVKKHIFARNFFKVGAMDLKICAKKQLVNRSGFSLKILWKSDHFSKPCEIFKVRVGVKQKFR
eukprot:UN01895